MYGLCDTQAGKRVHSVIADRDARNIFSGFNDKPGVHSHETRTIDSRDAMRHHPDDDQHDGPTSLALTMST